MSYANPDDLMSRYEVVRLAELSDPEGAQPLNDVMQTALDDASSEVDGYLDGRFTLPIPTDEIPTALKQITCDIAVYRLFSLRPLGDVEDARARYKDAIARLKAVSAGDQDLGLSASAKSPEGSPVTFSGARIYDQASLGEFRHPSFPSFGGLR